jgi:hypothetical protein
MSVIRNILDRYFLVFGILSVLLLLATVFLGVLWYRDPAGNYEPLTVVMAVLAGLIGTPSLWEAYQRQRELQEQKQDAFRRLDQLVSAVAHSVAHDHNFRNKADWSAELDELANADRNWLGDLYLYVKNISWKVRDGTFSHGAPDASKYCCSELLADLYFLQMNILPLAKRAVRLTREQSSAKEEELAHKIIVHTIGGTFFDTPRMVAAHSKNVADFVGKWRRRDPSIVNTFKPDSVWRRYAFR